jgi:hypothetical protein
VACNETVTLADLLPFDPDAEVTLEGIPVMDFVWLLAEPLVTAYEPDAPVGVAVRKELDEEKRNLQVARVPADEATASEEIDALAAELGVPEGEVRGALLSLVGRTYGSGRWQYMTLQRERDRRLRESAEDLSDPNHVRALRGDITRQLMRELRDEIAAMKENDGQHHESSGRVAHQVADTRGL